MQKKQLAVRGAIYLLGMLILTLGLTLNAKSGLGASAIASVPYTLNRGLGMSYANLTLITYCLLVGAQYFIKGKAWRWTDLLQIVVSIVFTRFMALFENIVPYQCGFLPVDILVLLLAIVFTAVGAAMTINMRLIPNPGDGIVSSISDRTGKELGICKNFFDLGCVAISLAVGLAFGNAFLGVGLGTILSMLGIGRVISLFNRFAKKPMQAAAGLES